MITVPLKTAGSNARECWQARSSRVKKERRAVAWMLATATRPSLPCSVLLTRVAFSSGLDDDNLRAALKGVRDEIAKWLGVDDRHSARVRYLYAQVRGGKGSPQVRIEFGPPASGAQLELLGETVLPRQEEPVPF